MRRRWARTAVAGATVVALLLVVWVNRADLPAAVRALRGADPRWLAGGLLTLTVWWSAWALLYLSCRRITRAGGYREFRWLVPVVVGAVAANLVVKSGGLAGLALFLDDGRRRRLAPSRVGSAYVLAAVLAEGAFFVTLVAGISVVWASARLTRTEAAAVTVFLAFLVARAGLLLTVIRSREAFVRMWGVPARWRDRLLRRPATGCDPAKPNEVYDAVTVLRARPSTGLPPFGLALGVDALGVAMLWTALAAVGGGNRPLVALVAYAISAVFGMVGFLPGGLGFVEVGSAAVMVSFGVPVGVAAAAAVVFRLWEFWLPLAVGAVAVWWLNRRRPGPADRAGGSGGSGLSADEAFG